MHREGAAMENINITFDPELDFPARKIRTALSSFLLLCAVVLGCAGPHAHSSSPEPRDEGIRLRLSLETGR